MVETLWYNIIVLVLLYYTKAAKAEGACRCSDDQTYVSLTCSSSLGKFETCSLQDINSIITRVWLNASDSRCSNGKGNFSFDEKRNLLTVYNGCMVKAEMCKNVSDTITSSAGAEKTETTDLKVRLYVGVALGVVAILIVIATVCFISRRNLKRSKLRKESQKNSTEEAVSIPAEQSPDNISNVQYCRTPETTAQITARHPKRDCEVIVSNEAEEADFRETEIDGYGVYTDLSASFGNEHFYERAIHTPPKSS